MSHRNANLPTLSLTYLEDLRNDIADAIGVLEIVMEAAEGGRITPTALRDVTDKPLPKGLEKACEEAAETAATKASAQGVYLGFARYVLRHAGVVEVMEAFENYRDQLRAMLEAAGLSWDEIANAEAGMERGAPTEKIRELREESDALRDAARKATFALGAHGPCKNNGCKNPCGVAWKMLHAALDRRED